MDMVGGGAFLIIFVVLGGFMVYTYNKMKEKKKDKAKKKEER